MIGPMVFIELKKAYDRVASQLVSQTLKKKASLRGILILFGIHIRGHLQA